MKQAERLVIDDKYVSWLAEANGCVAQFVVTDPDLVLYGRPFATPHVMGVELVDAEGKSYWKAYRCA